LLCFQDARHGVGAVFVPKVSRKHGTDDIITSIRT
jgi:hypothetical protein